MDTHEIISLVQVIIILIQDTMHALNFDVTPIVQCLSNNMMSCHAIYIDRTRQIVWCKLHKKQHVSAFFGKSVLKCHLT